MFLGQTQPPVYHTTAPSSPIECIVDASVQPVRPLFASAILRLKQPFSEGAYKSFIDLQDKLHMNLCRQRKLVAIGTHDLDTIEAPFRYMARDPKEIKFAPLNKDQEYTAEELMTVYEVGPLVGWAWPRLMSRRRPIVTWQSTCPSSVMRRRTRSFTTPRTECSPCRQSSIRSVGFLGQRR